MEPDFKFYIEFSIGKYDWVALDLHNLFLELNFKFYIEFSKEKYDWVALDSHLFGAGFQVLYWI